MADCDVCRHPILDTAWVCTTCSARLAAALREAAELWPELDVTITRQDRMGEPGPRPRGRAPASPIRPGGDPSEDDQPGWPAGLVVDLAASQVADDVRNTVTTWARHIAEERWSDGRPVRPAGPWCAHDCGHGSCAQLWDAHQAQTAHDRDMPPPEETSALMRWLADRLEWARHQPWAAECVGDLSEVRRLLVRAVDQPADRVYLGPCGEMDGLTGACPGELRASPAATTARCPECGTQHPVDRRRDWLQGLVLDHTYTAAEIAAAYPHVRADRIRQWASRGQLANHGTDRRGHPLYPLREVLDLAARPGRPGRKPQMVA